MIQKGCDQPVVIHDPVPHRQPDELNVMDVVDGDEQARDRQKGRASGGR